MTTLQTQDYNFHFKITSVRPAMNSIMATLLALSAAFISCVSADDTPPYEECLSCQFVNSEDVYSQTFIAGLLVIIFLIIQFAMAFYSNLMEELQVVISVYQQFLILWRMLQ